MKYKVVALCEMVIEVNLNGEPTITDLKRVMEDVNEQFEDRHMGITVNSIFAVPGKEDDGSIRIHGGGGEYK